MSVGAGNMRRAACWAYEPSVPAHATMACVGNVRPRAARTASRTRRTSGLSPWRSARCRAFEMEKSVEKNSRAPFSYSGPTACVTRARISRSRAGS